ncbi:MAG: sulfotransferase [Bacteroidales bacterium]|nr:sulfotransferase [Bacteroidales bacterium]
MIEPIIHIGFPKTASRWFQRQFLPYVENITIISKKEIFRTIFNDQNFIPDYESIKSQFTNYSGKLILSDHGFVGTNHSLGIRNYLTREHTYRLKKIFPNAKIILFIRNQPDIIASTYLQYIREGGTYTLSKFIRSERFRKLNDLIFFYYPYFEYHKLIEFYEELYPPENIFVYLFEDFCINPKVFISNLSKTFDFKYDPQRINYNKFNPRYRKGIIPLLRFSNHFTEKNIINKNYFIHIPAFFEYSRKAFSWLNQWEIFGNPPSSEIILGKNNLEKINSYYRKSNRILVEKYKLDNILKFKYPV